VSGQWIFGAVGGAAFLVIGSRIATLVTRHLAQQESRREGLLAEAGKRARRDDRRFASDLTYYGWPVLLGLGFFVAGVLGVVPLAWGLFGLALAVVATPRVRHTDSIRDGEASRHRLFHQRSSPNSPLVVASAVWRHSAAKS